MISQKEIEEAADKFCTGNALYGSMYNGFIEGAAFIRTKYRYTKTEDSLPPAEGGYLVKYRGYITILNWNPKHDCWDDESGDDYKCDPLDVQAWMEIPY